MRVGDPTRRELVFNWKLGPGEVRAQESFWESSSQRGRCNCENDFTLRERRAEVSLLSGKWTGLQRTRQSRETG